MFRGRRELPIGDSGFGWTQFARRRLFVGSGGLGRAATERSDPVAMFFTFR
jgi:hypothetical protein